MFEGMCWHTNREMQIDDIIGILDDDINTYQYGLWSWYCDCMLYTLKRMTLSNRENDPVESSNSKMFFSALHSGTQLQLAGVTQGVATLDCAHSHHSAQSAWGLHVETM